MTGCRDMDKKPQNTPKVFFSPFLTPRFFFKNRALSLLYPYGALTSGKKIRKTNEQFLRHVKMNQGTDRRTDRPTDGQAQFLRTPLGNPGFQNGGFWPQNFESKWKAFKFRILKNILLLFSLETCICSTFTRCTKSQIRGSSCSFNQRRRLFLVCFFTKRLW